MNFFIDLYPCPIVHAYEHQLIVTDVPRANLTMHVVDRSWAVSMSKPFAYLDLDWF